MSFHHVCTDKASDREDAPAVLDPRSRGPSSYRVLWKYGLLSVLESQPLSNVCSYLLVYAKLSCPCIVHRGGQPYLLLSTYSITVLYLTSKCGFRLQVHLRLGMRNGN